MRVPGVCRVVYDLTTKAYPEPLSGNKQKVDMRARKSRHKHWVFDFQIPRLIAD